MGGALRVNHFGWRLADRKIAVLLGNGGASVQVRRSDHSVAATVTAGPAATDEDSQDSAAPVDFTTVTATGDYYLYVPALGLRSYAFRIAPDVYDVVGAAAMKAFYFQRCNHSKALPYASDALPGFAGRGAQWADGACHLADAALMPGPGSAASGTLDLRGGWHDAGDYQKTLWSRGVPELLFAYELNPGAWRDGQLNLPESGNGVPDLLDEVRWELDLYVRMQRPDGHVLSSAKGRDATVASPPSASDERRVYFDSTSPEGGGWSGGGVTLTRATASAVLSLAHAAIVFRGAGQAQDGERYAAAATAGWAWLQARAVPAPEAPLKASAASAVFRMDPTIAGARAAADAFDWETWNGTAGSSASPGDGVIALGAWHYLANASGTAVVKSQVRAGVAQAIVETAFREAGVYGGMLGEPGNGWDWSWGSNRNQAAYGANLMLADRFGAVGSRASGEVRFLAQKYLHYLLGLNPLNMLYLTNMAAYGGEHSSFQIYHAWFSHSGGDGDHGNAQYNGKPAGVDEPLYPYHPGATQTSVHGPPPGFVPGGPNAYYSGSYRLADRARPPYAYRDFSVGCDWSGSACRAASWEITEPMQAYQGAFVLLASFFMSRP
ncbi:MAG: glycoside hydrolase family 9 protein [Archangiaceae bacterium]|nr:glycoside hydrolase family 9 protein [Archangiaceae bacterium]